MSDGWNRLWSILRPCLPWLPIPLVAFLAVALITRFTARDANVPLALIYYFGQPFVFAAFLMAAALIWWTARLRSLAIVALLLAGACGVWWAQANFAPYRETTAPRIASARLMLWNLNGAWLGTRALGKIIREEQPDVVGLLETWLSEPLLHEVIQASEIPYNYAYAGQDYGMILLARGSVLDVRSENIAARTHLLAARLELAAGSARVALVDVPSNPFRSRSIPLNAVGLLARELRDEPLVLFGDFNTPPDSLHFAALRSELRNAFEAAGEGYAPTWPMPLPLLALDQVWLGRAWEALRCRARTTLFSDHRYLICDMAPLPGSAALRRAPGGAIDSRPRGADAMAPAAPWGPLHFAIREHYDTVDAP